VAGAWRSPPTTSRVEVKERIVIYIYSPLWDLADISSVNFTLCYTNHVIIIIIIIIIIINLTANGQSSGGSGYYART